MTALWPLLVGFGLGLRHATDADHVVAVGTLLDREPTPLRAARLAALWGLGHSMTFFGLGLLVVLFGVRTPPRFERATEGVVAAMLVGLGVWTLVAKRRHAHVGGARLRPVLVGLTHGLAGSAAIGLVALTAVPTRAAALLYLALFGAGTVLGMVGLTVALALPMLWSVRRFGGVSGKVVTLAAASSVALGAFLAVEVALGAP